MSTQALHLIAENIRTKNPVLDLGNCGLTELYPELLEELAKTADWLETFILSSNWWDWTVREWRYSQNKGEANQIIMLPALPPLPQLKIAILANLGANNCTPLAALTGLQKLDISGNRIDDCTPLAALTGLQTLDISGNQIADCRPLAVLTGLQTLNISYNGIADCRPLATLSGLQTLNISGNQIDDCTPLAALTGLQTLDISDNQIADCKPLATLTGLQTLNISGNQIDDCTPLAALTGLQTLYIYNNQIADCTPLAALTGLQTLNISGNRIDDCKPLAALTGLQTLYISGNRIDDCKPLAALTGLQTLYIYNNQIADCTPLAALTGLQTLDISDNQIADCKPLAALTGLQTLYISGNRIDDCTPLAVLTGLQKLDISGNNIHDCKPLLHLIKKGLTIKLEPNYRHIVEHYNDAQSLYLYNNPITKPPMEILQQGNEAVIRYFESGQLQPLNECKLIFVGDGQVGKTSLMRRLVGQPFNQKEQTTHGINKVAWKGIKNIKKEGIRVNLWDFGGQHIQHSLHQFFFTERVIYVLVLNPRNDEKAGYWLEQIATLGKDSHVLVVYNWKEDKDKEANYLNNFYELRKKYSYLPAPFLLSCKTGKGIADFKKAVKSTVLKHEGLKTQYPATWFNIKARLEKDIPVDASYIGYQTYKQWCDEADYKDAEAQKELLKILDSIGSIVFFDKPILKEYPVLNPEWITTGAYAVLVAPQTKDKQGHLNWDDLKAIFKEKKTIFSDKEISIQFDEHQFLFIMELMLTYNICQKNPFAQNEYLIPAAFGERPAQDYEHEKAGAKQYRLKFEATFEMLIIHRFIAKNLLKITRKDYWQSGIFIKHPGSETFALVETNQYSKEINCWIKGENIRGFWEVIRADFHEILSMYHNLPFTEEVLYVKDGREVFLPYHEMVNAFKNGVLIIPYHPTYQLTNINVVDVLEEFVSLDKIMDLAEENRLLQELPQPKRKPNRTKTKIKAPEIFFSYAWGEEREKIVDQLYDALLADNYAVKRDKKDLQYGDLITPFMDKIGASDCIIVAISDKYLKSEYCMYELHKAYEQSKSDFALLKERVYPIRVESLQLDRPAILGSYFDHWEALEAEWEDLVSSKASRITAAQHKKYGRIKGIASKLGDLLDFLADINTSTTETLSKDNFEPIKQIIQQRMQQNK